jgi:hypothetical protein
MALGPLGLVDFEDPPLSLADEAIDLAESYMRVPTGLHATEPMVLTPEQVEFLIEWYRVTADGRSYVWNRILLIGPKGWSKSPLGGVDTFFHLVGPSIPDGLDAYGRPVGRPHPAPWEQIAGTSEDNTDNLYMQFHASLKESPALDDFGIDLGLTRTFLEGRPGRVEPVTASAISRTGNPISNLKREETWQWLRRNGGHALASALDANARKMRARVMDLSNMPVPGSDSTAERTRQAVLAGRNRTLIVTIGEQAPVVEDITDDEQCMTRLRAVYGSHLTERGGWIDAQELLDARPPGDNTESQWLRLFANQESGEAEEVFDPVAYQAMVNADAQLVLGDTIAVGFDGSDTGDATALYAARWPDWTVFKLAVWEPPMDPVSGHRLPGWKVPRSQVRATIRATLQMYRVVRGYADPAYWQSDIDELSAEFGESFMRFPHHSASRIGPACERWDTMFAERVLRFAVDEDNTLVKHAGNAYREPCGAVGSHWWRPKRRIEGQPIDAFSAAISAVHALGDAVAEGKVAPDEEAEDFADVI